MSKVLILMRHAKSGWDDPLQEDHERGLTDRGRRGAAEIGGFLKKEQLLPDEIISSDATRTKETVEGLGLNEDIPTEYRRDLYLANSDVMLGVLKKATAGTVMMVGHNPGIVDFADRLLKVAPMHPDFARYPTAATLFVTLEIENWADLKFGEGTAMAFAVPTKVKDQTA